MTNTTTETPACPDPHLYTYTVYKTDRRTKTGSRVLEEYQMQFQDERLAEQHAQDVKGFRPEILVVYRKYWVLKQNFMAPHKAYWERWDTPYCCSPSSELYWTM